MEVAVDSYGLYSYGLQIGEDGSCRRSPPAWLLHCVADAAGGARLAAGPGGCAVR